MRKIMKRGFCLFLVAVLLAGLVPYAFADEAKPTDVSEDAAEPTEETTAPPETTVPSESTEPPSEATEPPVTTEATEPDADPVEDDMEDDRLLSDSISTYASTVSNVLLFDQASPNYTTVLKSQISVTYQPNGTDAAKTAYIKNLGWHFARYNNTPYKDDPIYCIEPCKNYAASTSGNYMDQDLGVSGSGSSRGSNVWYAMPSSYRQAIALTLLYSKQLWNSNYSVKTTAMANNPNVSTRIATQFLIYEIVTGLRDADTFSRKNSNGYTSGDVFYNAGVANVSGFADKYNSIVSSVQSAMKIPSFTNRSSGSAPTLTMSGSQVSVTDSNGVLGNFSFTNGNGASFSKSGNTLTITKTGTISPSTVFSATRSLPSVENSTVSIYYSASSTYQTCVKLYSPQVETLRAYFKINAPNPGAIALVKTTEDGQNLSGWRFALYSNAACTTLVSGPHTTDSSGKISITGLNAGTYYVKELGHSDSSISSRYTCSGDNPQKVTVSNGATTSVSFYNKLAVGALAIRKSTNTGNHLGGWKFIVKKDGAEIPGSPFTTNETGIIRISNLAPGKYVVLESPTDDPYWTAELGYHTVTVEYGKTAVDQWLNKEQGLGCFTKSTKVDIYTYVTENTFDSYLYQLVEGKQKFIGQIMTSKSPVRSAEDIDETALSYAEIKALCSGNPHIKEKMDLDIEVQKLKLLRSSHMSQRYALEDKLIHSFLMQIASTRQMIDGLQSDMVLLKENTRPNKDGFSPMVIDGHTLTEKKAAGTALLDACNTMTGTNPIPLGSYRGFQMTLCFDSFEKLFKISLQGALTYKVSLGTDVFGNIQRIDNLLESMPTQQIEYKEKLKNLEIQVENAKQEVAKPFSREAELKEKSARLDHLNILLNMDKRENEIVDGVQDEGEIQPQRESRNLER